MKDKCNYEPNETDPGLNATPTRDGGRQLIQQTLHRGLFETRPRCYSVGDRPASGSTTVNLSETEMSETRQELASQPPRKGAHHFDWQKVPEVRTKKRKLAPKTPSPDQMQTMNRFSSLAIDSAEPNMTENKKDKRESKPPPIILYGIEDLNKLTKLLETVVDNSQFTYKIISKLQLRINCKTTEIYKKVIELIRENQLIGHTFTRKEDRPFRIIIKNLHPTTPIDEIKKAIKETGNVVRGEIINARYGPNKTPLSTFFVNIEPAPNNKMVKDIKYIYHQSVKIEDPKKKSTMVQCKRCQQYGHSRNNCMRPHRCVKCAENHKTPDCPKKDRNTPAKCALCLENHPANYKGCQVYQEIHKRKILSRNKPHYKGHTAMDTLLNPKPTQFNKTPFQTTAKTQNNLANNQPERQHQDEKDVPHTEARPYQSTRKSYAHVLRDQDPTAEIDRLEILIIKQSEKIDLLIHNLSSLIGLMTTLISKKSIL